VSQRSSDKTTTSPAAAGTDTRPRCLFLSGRGGTGKSLLLRWMAERAFAAGRTLVIADGDRTNRALPKYFDGVLFPESVDDGAVAHWLETVLEQMVIDRFTLVVDLGGGDQVLKRLAHELALQSLLEENGITPVLLHLIGPEIESLGPLSTLEKPNPADQSVPLFAPPCTALILNAGLIPNAGTNPAEVFTPIREHRVFQDAIQRGARALSMPRLWPALEINRRELSFASAVAGQAGKGPAPLGLGDRQRVKLWLRAMDQDFASIAEWLP
jgi:hypothetical protein